jgi:hypothetical protein
MPSTSEVWSLSHDRDEGSTMRGQVPIVLDPFPQWLKWSLAPHDHAVIAHAHPKSRTWRDREKLSYFRTRARPYGNLAMWVQVAAYDER